MSGRIFTDCGVRRIAQTNVMKPSGKAKPQTTMSERDSAPTVGTCGLPLRLGAP